MPEPIIPPTTSAVAVQKPNGRRLRRSWQDPQVRRGPRLRGGGNQASGLTRAGRCVDHGAMATRHTSLRTALAAAPDRCRAGAARQSAVTTPSRCCKRLSQARSRSMSRAIRMLAELAGRIGRYKDAESLLRRALELSPAFTAARANLAIVLYRLNRPAEAIAELDRRARRGARQSRPRQPEGRGARPDRRASTRRSRSTKHVLADAPEQPKVWMSYGHMLKTVGRQADGVAAYRRALDARARAGRSVVEPRQPQDGPLRRRRHRRDGSGARARRHLPTRTASTSTSRSARRSRTAREADARLRALRRRQCAAPHARSSTTPTRPNGFVDRQHRAAHARILRRARSGWAAPRPTRSSSSACRAPDRP